MTQQQILILTIGCVLLFLILSRALTNPWRILWKFVRNVVLGCIGLYVINIVGEAYHVHVGINPFTAGTVGVLGIPGIAALVVAKIWLLS